MNSESQTTYLILYRPAGEWRRYELSAADLSMATKGAGRLAPKGYEVAQVNAIESHEGQTAGFDSRLEAVTQAVYDCEMTDGDTLAEILHDTDYIDASVPIEKQLEQVKALCRLIARAALDASHKV